jgi:hypothetical protein
MRGGGRYSRRFLGGGGIRRLRCWLQEYRYPLGDHGKFSDWSIGAFECLGCI